MTRIFFRKSVLFFLLIPVFSGCAALPARKASTDPPVVAASTTGAGFHFSVAILHSLNQNIAEAIREMEQAIRLDPASPYLAKELAALHAEQGDTAKAVMLCEKILQQHPDDIDTRLLLGGLYMSRQEYPAAAAEYRRVIGLDPKRTAARFYLGTSLAEMKRLDEAVGAFQDLLKIEPDHFMGNYYLARIWAEMGRYDEAEAGFKKTLSLRPPVESTMIELGILYERQKKIAQAIEVYQNYVDLFPARLQARIKLGELFLHERRHDEAERVLLEALALDAKNREVRMALALLHLERGQHEKAIDYLSALVEEHPAEYRLIYLLGTTYEEIKASEKALETLRQIPAASEQFGSAQIRIGMILKKERRMAEAVNALLLAIRKRGDLPPLYAYLASLYEAEKNYSAAEGIVREGLRTHPDSVDLHFGLGVLFEKTDRFDESIEAMKAVLKIEPDHAEALNFIGYMYADRGIHLEEAERMIRRALELKPGNGYMIDSLGWVLFRRGRLAEAVRYLKEAAEILPEDAAILEHLGDAYLRTGQPAEAAEAYEKALRFNPESSPLKKKLEELQPKKSR